VVCSKILESSATLLLRVTSLASGIVLVRLDVFNSRRLIQSRVVTDLSQYILTSRLIFSQYILTSRLAWALTLCYSEVLGALLDFDPFEVNQIGISKSSRKGKS
jgi:hypothetical protein